MRDQLIVRWDNRPVNTIGGVDVSIKDEFTRAAIVLLRYPDLAPMDSAVADAPLVFPYIPGLLSFREGPAVLAAWHKLQKKPDLLMFDGQGIAHPRGIGIASQMGLWLDRPTVGVAKSRLYGIHTEVGPKRGDRVDLLDKNTNVIGAVLRTREPQCGGKVPAAPSDPLGNEFRQTHLFGRHRCNPGGEDAAQRAGRRARVLGEVHLVQLALNSPQRVLGLGEPRVAEQFEAANIIGGHAGGSRWWVTPG